MHRRSRSKARLSTRLHEALVGQIRKLRREMVELQRHDAGLAVAVLGDDELSLVPDRVELVAPGAPFGTVRWIRLAQVICFAIHEDDDVGVLLDRAAVAQ